MKLNSIKARLIAYVGVLILVLAIALALTAYLNSSNVIIEETEARLIERAEDVGDIVQTRLDVRKAELEAIANREVVREMDWEEIKPVLEEEVDRTEYATISLVDLDGRASYIDGDELELVDRDYVQEALEGNTNISDMIISRAINAPVAMVATPIEANGEIVGALIARMLGSDVIDIVSDIEVGEQGYAYMFNNEGTVIAHQDEGLVMEQFNPLAAVEEDESLRSLAEMTEAVINSESGFEEYIFEGEDLFIGYSELADMGWNVGVTAPIDQVLSGMYRLRRMMIILSILFLLIATFLVYRIANSLSAPIEKIADDCEVMAEGDFTHMQEEKWTKRKDEIGKLARAFNHINTSMEKIVRNILDKTEDMSAYSEELSASAEEGNASIETTSGLIQDISAGIEEISASSQEVASFSEEANQQTDTGSENINQTVNSIKEINQTVDETVEVINKLDENSDEIGHIVELITNIAEQTNLLALNAAIEAARAGEHGQGFAVVADEIRELASETAEATEQISSLVDQTQKQSKLGIKKVNQVEDKAKKGKKIAEETGEVFDKIKESVEETSLQIDQTANATNDLAQSSDQIIEATDDIKGMSNEVTNSSQELARMAQELQKLIKQFKV